VKSEIANDPYFKFPSTATASVCISFSGYTDLVSDFYPPFIYSYQCGSSILTSFTPVLMYGMVFRTLWLFLKILFWSSNSKTLNSFSQSQLLSPSGLASNSMQCVVLLLTFGMASPPLAAAIVWFAVLNACCSLFVFGNCVGANAEHSKSAVDANLILKCVGIWQAPHVCIRIGICVSSLFWAFMVFDMVGDSNAQNPIKAVWAPISVLCIGLAVLVCSWLSDSRAHRGRDGEHDKFNNTIIDTLAVSRTVSQGLSKRNSYSVYISRDI
jgi:hypothetical protein